MEHYVPGFQRGKFKVTIAYQLDVGTIDVRCDAVWNDICLLLTPLVKDWIYRFNVTSWRGQESDIVLDIVQETLCKAFKYVLKAQHQDITATSLKRLSIVIAKNLLLDLLRGGDHSLLIELDVASPEMEMVAFDEEDDLVYYRSVWMVVNSVRGGRNWLLKDSNIKPNLHPCLSPGKQKRSINEKDTMFPRDIALVATLSGFSLQGVGSTSDC